MSKDVRFEPQFVTEIPRELEPGNLYISIPYTTAAHLCPCGCGHEVVTTFHPARFSLTFDGETVSLHPSVGNSAFPCRSHYFIKQNRVRWCQPLSDVGIARARKRDQRAVTDWERGNTYAPDLADAQESPEPPSRSRWKRLLGIS
ncbi:MAG: DUF6527 family protein [Solirubrobacteraceae bacterium]